MGKFLGFDFSTSTFGCCLFCQTPVGGVNKECITHGFDVVCMDCAREIASLLPVYTCEECGMNFPSRMSLVAHMRVHKSRKEAVEDGGD